MLLHARIDGGVDAQAIAVDIIVRAVGFLVLVAPAIEGVVVPVIFVGIIGIHIRVVAAHGLLGHHDAAQFLTEVWRNAVLVVIHGMAVEQQFALLRLVAALGCEHAFFVHLVEHHIAACTHAVGIAERVVVRRVLAHAHKCGGLFKREVLGLLAKVHPCGALDAHCIVQEVELVEVHLDDFLLGVVALQFERNHPLDGLLQRSFKDVGRLGRVELLGKLLRDGTATTGTRLTQDDALHK